MHLGRFNYVTRLLLGYYKENGLLVALDKVLAQLQAYIATPTTESSKAFRLSIDAFYELVLKVPVAHNAASIKQIIADTGGAAYFAHGLEYSLKEIIDKQAMTPADMLVSLTKFRADFAKYITSITTITTELASLGVEHEELGQDQFEFGALFPKELVGISAENVEAELEHINRLFKALNELMGNGATSPTVRSISSSWWQFFLGLDCQQIAAITLAIERIVALYKNNLEIQKLRRETEKQVLGKEIVAIFNNLIDEKLKIGMVEIAKEIRSRFQKNTDEQRCNELETQLRMELVHVAKRINQGAAYEVRAGLPIKPKPLTAGEETDVKVKEHQEAMKAYEEKQKIANAINTDGENFAASIEELSGETQLLTDYAKLTEDAQIKDVKASTKK
jgi:hypothetical protein